MLARNLKRHMFIHVQDQLARVDCDQAGCSWDGADVQELRRHYRQAHRLTIPTIRALLHNFKMRSVVAEEESGLQNKKKKKIVTVPATNVEERQRRPLRRAAIDDSPVVKDELLGGKRAKAWGKLAATASPPSVLSQTSNQQSQQTKARVEALLVGMKTLSAAQRIGSNDRRHSPDQLELLRQLFRLTRYPTEAQRAALSEKSGLPMKKIHYWMDNNRRKLQARQERQQQEEGVEGGLKRSRVKKLKYHVPLPPQKESGNSGSSGTNLTYRLEDVVRSELTLEEFTATGDAVCIGVELWPTNQRCLLCSFGCSFRGNLMKHLRLHGFRPKFCKMPREETELEDHLSVRGCRKLFSEESFDLHTCSSRPPQYFGSEPWRKAGADASESPKKPKRREKTENGDSSSSSSGSGNESEGEATTNPGQQLVKELTAAGEAVCVGWEVNDSCSQCTLCSYSCPVRGNLYKHTTAHGVTPFKFCSTDREENSELPKGNRGCRKIFAAATFDQHICTAADAEQLGEFPLLFKTRLKKLLKRKHKDKKSDHQLKYGVPDGSPAKFYSDRYAKLFQQLESKSGDGGGTALSMDTMFMRNGKMELCYLTAWQMQAVREFAGGSEKYFLVRSCLYFRTIAVTGCLAWYLLFSITNGHGSG